MNGYKSRKRYCVNGECLHPASYGVLLYPLVMLMCAIVAMVPFFIAIWKDNLNGVSKKFEQLKGEEAKFARYFSDLLLTHGRPKPFYRYVFAAWAWLLSNFIVWAIYYGFFGLEPFTQGCTMIYEYFVNTGDTVDYLKIYFPSYLECIPIRTGPSGSKVMESILCTLPSNEIIRFWFFPLWLIGVAATLSNLIYIVQVARLLGNSYRKSLLIQAVARVSKSDAIYLTDNMGLNQWLLLYKVTFIAPTSTITAILKLHRKEIRKMKRAEGNRKAGRLQTVIYY